MFAGIGPMLHSVAVCLGSVALCIVPLTQITNKKNDHTYVLMPMPMSLSFITSIYIRPTVGSIFRHRHTDKICQ